MSAAAILRRLTTRVILTGAFAGLVLSVHAEVPWNERHSGYEDMSARNESKLPENVDRLHGDKRSTAV